MPSITTQTSSVRNFKGQDIIIATIQPQVQSHIQFLSSLKTADGAMMKQNRNFGLFDENLN